jgi:hypothetical protein
MATCKFCGEWAGILSDRHYYCAQAAAAGKTNDEIRATRNVPAAPAKPPGPVTMQMIAGGVFLGEVFFAVALAIVYAVIHILSQL